MLPSIRPALAATSRCIASSNPSTTIRCLSTTTPLSRQKPSHRTVDPELVPDYPYGPFRTYKQANEGLYGGAKIRFGNTVSEKYNRKSRTTWLPNRHTKRLWSKGLQAFIRVRLTARTLRTIDKLGGIDEYVLGPKARRIKELGPAGWALRWKVMQSPIIQEQYAREREALGLPPKPVQVVGEDMDFPPEVLAEAARQAGNAGRTPGDLMRDLNAMLEKGEILDLEGEAHALSAEEQRLVDENATPEQKKILQELDDMEETLKRSFAEEEKSGKP